MSRKTDGFTLIELLVVISIIALLISILLPSLAKARESARQTQCAIGMRNIALAHTMYAGDSKNRYFSATTSGNVLWHQPNYWPTTTAYWPADREPMLKGGYLASNNIFYCPNYNNISPVPGPSQWWYNNIGYVIYVNSFWSNNPTWGPSVDGKWDTLENVKPDQALAQDILVNRNDGVFIGAHGEVGNVVFTDVHVERLRKESFTDNHSSNSWFIPGVWLMHPNKM